MSRPGISGWTLPSSDRAPCRQKVYDLRMKYSSYESMAPFFPIFYRETAAAPRASVPRPPRRSEWEGGCGFPAGMTEWGRRDHRAARGRWRPRFVFSVSAWVPGGGSSARIVNIQATRRLHGPQARRHMWVKGVSELPVVSEFAQSPGVFSPVFLNAHEKTEIDVAA